MTESIKKRSPFHTKLEVLKPKWGEAKSMAVALSFGEAQDELLAQKHLAMADLSFFPKLVVKGPAAVSWLEEQGIDPPTEVLATSDFSGGGLVIRSDRQEVFLEDGVNSQRVAHLDALLPLNDLGAFRVLRQDASLLLCGQQACGFNFSTHVSGLVMTRVAGVSCWVLKVTIQDAEGFRLWMDASYAPYFWAELYKIVAELNGRCIGLNSIYQRLS
jgi:hypothetical protein